MNSSPAFNSPLALFANMFWGGSNGAALIFIYLSFFLRPVVRPFMLAPSKHGTNVIKSSNGKCKVCSTGIQMEDFPKNSHHCSLWHRCLCARFTFLMENGSFLRIVLVFNSSMCIPTLIDSLHAPFKNNLMYLQR